MNKKAVLLIVLCICLIAETPAFAVRIVSPSPYVNTVAAFISGSKAKNGGTVSVALNEGSRGRKSLFKGARVSADDILHAYYDPAKLPYVAQAVLTLLSETDKQNYRYYQRRLAEFQAALDSVVSVGRYFLPKEKEFLDLTGVEGVLISAANNKTERPADSEMQRWKAGDTDSLKRLVELSRSRGKIILIDRWTPAPVISCLNGYRAKIYMPPADTGKNYFNSLGAIYKYVAKRAKEIKTTDNGKNRP